METRELLVLAEKNAGGGCIWVTGFFRVALHVHYIVT